MGNTESELAGRLLSWSDGYLRGISSSTLTTADQTPPPSACCAQFVDAPRIICCLAHRRTYQLFSRTGGSIITLRRHQALVIRPGTWILPHAEPRIDSVGIHLHADHRRLIWRRSAGGTGLDEAPQEFRLLAGASAHLAGLLDPHWIADGSALGMHRLANSIHRIVLDAAADLHRMPDLSGDRSYRSFIAAREYIHEHYFEDIDRTRVAQAIGMHPNHLSRLFARHGDGPDRGFASSLLHVRLSYAARLLRTTSHSVGDIARRCGFSDPSYFGLLFRQSHGRTALAYRTDPPTA